ncbi:zf-HC2 domain-containing protein [Xylanimonas allomyrinae]|uniref:Zf-HC2 domain-containing protein n=1 Tax=Xylanimonas allomyrinae TaxID=2509459 RepID=A0A4P6EL92_9MICO|nr:zf-HC2 domain-containing protein [Xylanimonas allomyrinae]QAY62029.1 zf-HC2 domain-containing protein [Xylanimonas allomyrinae]
MVVARQPGHLGDWLSPLADGQLAPAQAERALAHVAVCPACAAGLEAEREARRALATAADVAVSPGLNDRLMALSASVPSAAGDPLRERSDGPWPVGGPGAAAFTAPLSGDLMAVARRRRSRRVLAAGLGGIGLAAAALFAAGDLPVVVPDPAPAEALTLLARTGASGDAAGDVVLGQASSIRSGAWDAAALAWVTEEGWVPPASLPAGLGVSTLRLVGADATVLEIDLEGSAGHVVAREQRGRLDGTLAGGRTERIAGHTVTVLSTEPWHVAWQAGDVVVDVAADVPRDVLEAVLAAFPSDGYDAGVLPRIARGWDTVRTAVAGLDGGVPGEPEADGGATGRRG